MANIYNMSDTWNDGATTFTSIKMNVTDTASASGSLLMDLQVGGASKFSVATSGNLKWDSYAGDPELQVYQNGIFFRTYGIQRLGMSTNGLRLASDKDIGWANVSNSTEANPDLFLVRDAAGTLAQRNGTNAQTFNIYNTYTDASNYERGFMKWNSNVLQIGTEAAGTGSVRGLSLKTAATQIEIAPQNNVKFISSSGGPQVYITPSSGRIHTNASTFLLGDGSGKIELNPTSTGGVAITDNFLEAEEMLTAPAAGSATSARIFAEDDGAGKTRLMVQFGTGAAQQIAIEP